MLKYTFEISYVKITLNAPAYYLWQSVREELVVENKENKQIIEKYFREYIKQPLKLIEVAVTISNKSELEESLRVIRNFLVRKMEWVHLFTSGGKKRITEFNYNSSSGKAGLHWEWFHSFIKRSW